MFLVVIDIIMGLCVSLGYLIFCVGCMDYLFSKNCWFMEVIKDIVLVFSIYNLFVIFVDCCLVVYWFFCYVILMIKGRVISILSFMWGIFFIIVVICIYWEYIKFGVELDVINSLYNNIFLVCVLLFLSLVIFVINVKIILIIRD